MKNTISNSQLVVLYALFAALATIVNLGAQMLVIASRLPHYPVETSILAGTMVGLMLKYILDKRYIFRYRAESLAHDGKLFALYTYMGIFTTLLFWGTEYSFHWFFGTDVMRYLGGAIGLAAGYLIKYQLDKRFVFVPRAIAAEVVS